MRRPRNEPATVATVSVDMLSADSAALPTETGPASAGERGGQASCQRQVTERNCSASRNIWQFPKRIASAKILSEMGSKNPLGWPLQLIETTQPELRLMPYLPWSNDRSFSIATL